MRIKNGNFMEQVTTAGSSAETGSGSAATDLRQNYSALGPLMDGRAAAAVDSSERERQIIVSLRQVLADMQDSLDAEAGR